MKNEGSAGAVSPLPPASPAFAMTSLIGGTNKLFGLIPHSLVALLGRVSIALVF